MKQNVLGRVLISSLAGACLIWAISSPSSALPPPGHGHHAPFVFAPNSHPHGHSYSEWTASMWQWGLGLPLADHPFTDTSNFDVSEGQTGAVWYLAAPIQFAPPPVPTIVRSATIPAGKSLMVALIDDEWSSLEGYLTEQDQRDFATWQTDHVVPSSLFCTLDGQELPNPGNYRFASPQFSFDAPTPWIFGDTGGTGTAVADGYYVFLKKLHEGQHTLHFGGTFHFTLANDGFDFDATIDMTYNLTQLGCNNDDD